MLQTQEAIILSKSKYSDNSLIINALTPSFGVVSFIVSGISSQKSKAKRIAFQPGTIGQVVFYFKQKQGIQRIKEFKPTYSYAEIPFDIIKSSVAFFIAEITYVLFKQNDSDNEIFEYIKQLLILLDQTSNKVTNIPILFLLNCTAFVGVHPKNNYSNNYQYFNLSSGDFQSLFVEKETMSLEASVVFHELINLNLEDSLNFNCTKAIRNELLNALLNYYKFHFENFRTIKSIDVYKTVFND